jgi:bacteriocin biosynthesis cyclodehydratase domain-containing protein
MPQATNQRASGKTNGQPLKALAALVVDVPNGAILKRAALEIKIAGTNAAQALRIILAAARAQPLTLKCIEQLFDRPSQSYVRKLVQKLIQCGILVPVKKQAFQPPSVESNLDVFYWQFGTNALTIHHFLEQTRFLVVGINLVSRQLLQCLQESGAANLCSLDHPHFRNAAFFNKAGTLLPSKWPPTLPRSISLKGYPSLRPGDCLVVTSDWGGQTAMAEWNHLCLKHGARFVPVILHNMIGLIGPMVEPGKTACYECLLIRRRSHGEDIEIESQLDTAIAKDSRIVAFHPAMGSVLGSVAGFELVRMYSKIPPAYRFGKLLEVNLLSSEIIERPVLRIPRCPACSALHKTPMIASRTYPVSRRETSRGT